MYPFCGTAVRQPTVGEFESFNSPSFLENKILVELNFQEKKKHSFPIKLIEFSIFRWVILFLKKFLFPTVTETSQSSNNVFLKLFKTIFSPTKPQKTLQTFFGNEKKSLKCQWETICAAFWCDFFKIRVCPLEFKKTAALFQSAKTSIEVFLFV